MPLAECGIHETIIYSDIDFKVADEAKNQIMPTK
jgi:hypothetical protein